MLIYGSIAPHLSQGLVLQDGVGHLLWDECALESRTARLIIIMTCGRFFMETAASASKHKKVVLLGIEIQNVCLESNWHVVKMMLAPEAEHHQHEELLAWTPD